MPLKGNRYYKFVIYPAWPLLPNLNVVWVFLLLSLILLNSTDCNFPAKPMRGCVHYIKSSLNIPAKRMIRKHEVWTSFSSSGNRGDHMGCQATLNSGRKLFYVFSRTNRCSAVYSAKYNFSAQENFQQYQKITLSNWTFLQNDDQLPAVAENKIIYLNVPAKWWSAGHALLKLAKKVSLQRTTAGWSLI